ncbi:MAG: WD40 repeat domain-containing protein [Telluria sp.]
MKILAPKYVMNRAVTIAATLAALIASPNHSHATEMEPQPTSHPVAQRVAELPTSQRDAMVAALAFSPDGKQLAARSGWREIAVWDLGSKRVLRSLNLPTGANDILVTEALTFSPDGRFLAACHGKAQNGSVVTVWNTKNWALEHQIVENAPGGACFALGFSPHSETLYRLASWPTADGDNVIAYDTSTWTVRWGFHINSFEPYNLSISPDGASIAIGARYLPQGEKDLPQTSSAGLKPGQSALLLISSKAKEITKTLPVPLEINAFSRLTWSSGGHEIALASALGVLVFNVSDASTKVVVPATKLTSSKVALRYAKSDAYIVEACAFCRPGWARIWNADHTKLLQTLPADVGSLAVSPDGSYLATGEIGKTEVWNLH